MAGLQIRCYVDGRQEFIELYGNETIDMDVSFAEIQDITKKNSAFTKEFKVPGTKNNNYIFNYFFDINSVYLDWNPKKKFDADLIYDGYELYNGYIRMNSVDINKIEKVYSVTFYSAVGDLVANIGDKAMCEVDTTSINYYLSALTDNSFWLNDPDLQSIDTLVDWSGGTDWYGFTKQDSLLNGDVQLMLAQRGYDYTGNTFGDIRDIDTNNTPILYFSGATGFFDEFNPGGLLDSAVNLAYLIPSVRIRKMYELICSQAGYTLESNFFDTSYFGRMYLPLSFNTDSVYLNQSKDYLYSYFNSGGTFSSLSGISWESRNIYFDSSPAANFDLVYPIIEQEDNLNYNPPPADPAINNQQYLFFRAPVGTYQIALSATCVYTGTGTFDPTPSAATNATIGMVTYADATTISADTVTTTTLFANTFSTFFMYQTTFTSSTFNSMGYYGDFDYFFVAIDPIPDGYFLGIKVQLIGSSSNLPAYIELQKEMSCEYKQIDFISDINRMFNLVVVEHPIKPKTLIVEPIIDYIGKGDVLDWTDKVDFDSTLNLTPTSSIVNGSLFFANKIDKDYVNTQYNTKSNLIFGQNIINLGEDYKNEQTNLTQKMLGQNTDYYLNASGSTNIALSSYFITKQENINGRAVFEYRPFRSLPRVAFKGVPLKAQQLGQNSWKVRLGSSGFRVAYYQNFNRFTTYPFGLTGFSNYMIYNASDVFTTDELIFPEANTMYDVFYKDYIDDMISPENKIVNAKMYLTPWEVAGLYFNEKIIIKNASFRINKITGLSLLEPGMCNVQLVKLTRDYESFPIRYYDLIPCDCTDGEVIHTHTDLIFHIYAFENSYVSIAEPPYTIAPQSWFTNSNTYKVVRTEYNENYTYTKPIFNTGIINNASRAGGKQLYFNPTNCSQSFFSASGNTLNIYDEFSNTNVSACEDFYVINTGNSQTTFTFVYCDGTNGSWTLNPGSGISICAVYNTISGNNINICADVNLDCSAFTPLPTNTPSNTPGLSPTPTPSVTPTIPGSTPTPTPTGTIPTSCRENIVLNVTSIGWIKYDMCDGIQKYLYINSTGSFTLTDCIIEGTITQGIPYAQLAVFTITSFGTPC